jgi:PHD/YefM family antitoxin component YafN of YafNO toxin-antitoxin module
MDVAATEFTRNFPRYREEAQHGPVAVKSHDRVAGYFLSAREFENYQRLKAMEPKVLAVEEIDPGTIEALRGTKMDARHADLDQLLDD